MGISNEVIDKYFTATASRIGGIDLKTIAKETLYRHARAYEFHDAEQRSLRAGSVFQWRDGEEEHMYNPSTIYTLQKAVRLGDYQLYKQYSKLLHEDAEVKFNLRNLLDFKFCGKPDSTKWSWTGDLDCQNALNRARCLSVQSVKKRMKP